jgi:ActR/RegA family two-component response regulator
MSKGKILIIDDEKLFLELYEGELGRQGYVVETAMNREAALAKLDQPGWDVVLLDQKLQGSAGPDSGLNLIPEIVVRAPRARIILVTGFATAQAVTLAFEAGAHDYLQKDELFDALLVPKLHAAVEVARALRRAGMTSDETEAEIRQTWAAVQTEPDANRKGKLLEDLMVLILNTIHGFQQASPRRRNELEEIDILIRNESTDPLWTKEGPCLLVECKNWSKPVGVPELRDFFYKLEHRYGRCRLGLFVAPGGFAETFKTELLTRRSREHLVILLGPDELSELVESHDRNEFLKKRYADALVALNGH